MKNSIKILVLIFFISYSAYSQEDNETNYSSPIFNSEQESLNLLANLYSNQVIQEDASVLNQQNSVIIQQVGFNNSIYSQTRSQSSSLELYQNGDYNSINLDVNAPNLEAKILQNGDNNSVLDNIYYSNLDVKLEAIQNGNNLSISRIGVNSLSNKLQLVQEGSFKTITVISN